MEKFTTVSGPAAPMLSANVDTDVIIPIQRLVGTGRTGLGPYAFERLRYNKDGSDNPDFVLNRPQYRDSPILLAGPKYRDRLHQPAPQPAQTGRPEHRVPFRSLGPARLGSSWKPSTGGGIAHGIVYTYILTYLPPPGTLSPPW